MKFYLNLVLTCGLDRIREVDCTLLKQRSTAGADCVSNVAHVDRAEQLVVRANPCGQFDVQGFELVLTSLAWAASRIARASRARLICVICFSAPFDHTKAKLRGTRKFRP